MSVLTRNRHRLTELSLRRREESLIDEGWFVSRNHHQDYNYDLSSPIGLQCKAGESELYLYHQFYGSRYLTHLRLGHLCRSSFRTLEDAFYQPAGSDGEPFNPRYDREERGASTPVLAQPQLSTAYSRLSAGNSVQD